MSVKTKIINILILLFWLGILTGTGYLIYFVNKQHDEVKCSEVDILFDHSPDSCFVNISDVKSLILQTGDSLKSQPLSSIHLEKIKNKISENSFIKNVSIYSTLNGEIKINIKQRKPLMRVITGKGQSFYIDENGNGMPLSSNHSARVIVVTGKINLDTLPQSILDEKDTVKQKEFFSKTNIDSLFILAKTIDTSAFWKAQISQININEHGEIELIPQLGTHIILLGTIENLVEKFEKLSLFYKSELSNFGLNKYKIINLKYKNQLVCLKK